MFRAQSFWNTGYLSFYTVFCTNMECLYVHSKISFDFFDVFKFGFWVVGVYSPMTQN